MSDPAAAGRVLALCPAAEAMLLEGSVCVSTLAIIQPFLTDAALRPRNEQGRPKSDEAILARARVRPDSELRRAVHRRREEVRVGAQTVTRTLHLSSRGADDLDRTRVLVSRRSKRAVSRSEAAEGSVLRLKPLRPPRGPPHGDRVRDTGTWWVASRGRPGVDRRTVE